jgi:hypothetical protein
MDMVPLNSLDEELASDSGAADSAGAAVPHADSITANSKRIVTPIKVCFCMVFSYFILLIIL